MTSESREMDSGAAVRAKAISAFRSIRYWSSEAMLGYGVLVSCACARKAALTTTTSMKVVNALVRRIFRRIDFSSDRGFLAIRPDCRSRFLIEPPAVQYNLSM